MVFARSYGPGNSALTFKALPVPNLKPEGFLLFLCGIEFVSFSYDEVF